MNAGAPMCCGAEMRPLRLPTAARTRVGWVCLACGRKTSDEPTLMRGGRARRTNPEAAVVSATKQALAYAGFECLRVGQHRADLSGSDPGMVDLPVHIAGPLWLFVELKAPGKAKPGGCTPEQRRMLSLGHIVVSDDPERVVTIARRLRELLEPIKTEIEEAMR
jgi:hypothetical protein